MLSQIRLNLPTLPLCTLPRGSMEWKELSWYGKTRSFLLIGIDVRMCYLESCRRRMGLPLSDGGNDAKKNGDRAAHRGRPIVDAWLYEMGHRKASAVYKDLYGISFSLLMSWRRIPEVVDVCGFHASLKSDGTMKSRFQTLFDELFDAAAAHTSMEKLAAAFKQDKILLSKYGEVQNCYDAIIAANPPRWRGNQLAFSPWLGGRSQFKLANLVLC
jgi:hypothetical protein